jgi:hypothetical protein
MAKILITGGPVHAKLDSVKIITNRFRGGQMVEIARLLACESPSDFGRTKGHEVVFLHSSAVDVSGIQKDVNCVHHDGFYDYLDKVLSYARESDLVILGAAVANIIPSIQWYEDLPGGKFPSHLYSEGSEIYIPFTIAPRVINKVRQVAPRVPLVGFKLLSNVSHEDLVSAAKTVMQESGATYVVANDTRDLMSKYVLTREGGVYRRSGLIDLTSEFHQIAHDRYFKTVTTTHALSAEPRALEKAKHLAEDYKDRLLEGTQDTGMIFGCVAVRIPDSCSFVVSSRGKKSLDEFTTVYLADFRDNTVVIKTGDKKASLNAPLLAAMFKDCPRLQAVVHWHAKSLSKDVPVLPYAPPGTVRDSMRCLWGEDMFFIEGHGMFKVFFE